MSSQRSARPTTRRCPRHCPVSRTPRHLSTGWRHSATISKRLHCRSLRRSAMFWTPCTGHGAADWRACRGRARPVSASTPTGRRRLLRARPSAPQDRTGGSLAGSLAASSKGRCPGSFDARDDVVGKFVEHVAQLVLWQKPQRLPRRLHPGESIVARRFHRAVAGEKAERPFEVGRVVLALDDYPVPECPLGPVGTRDGLDERQCQLAFAKVVAHVLAGRRRVAAVVEKVIDDL